MSNAPEPRLDSRSPSLQAGTRIDDLISRLLGVCRSVCTAILPALLWVGLLLCLAVSPSTASGRSGESPIPEALGPGTVFSSVEAAVFDALRFVALETHLRHRGRIRAGTIFRVGDGFSYEEPASSLRTVWSNAPPVVRLKYAKADVASYVVHPRSGRASIDRANEGLRSALRRQIERSGSSTRPLFLLTPKHRVIRYAPGKKAEVISGLEDRRVVAVLP